MWLSSVEYIKPGNSARNVIEGCLKYNMIYRCTEINHNESSKITIKGRLTVWFTQIWDTSF